MTRQIRLIWIMLMAGLLSTASLANAQQALDPAADPNYGTWPLADFPDPFVMTVMAGGDVNANVAGAAQGCVGFVTSAPDLVFEYGGGPLRAFFVSEGDTTLVLHQPDGTYVCNDDAVGVNPVVDVPNAPAGSYALWIGAFNTGTAPGQVVITSGDSQPGALVSALLTGGATSAPTVQATVAPVTGTVDGLNPNAGPTFGIVPLAPGFQPDPTELALQAGGTVDVRALDLGRDCRGFVSAPPDARVAWTAPGRFLRIFVESADDLTLVVRLPDGTFACNDDFGGFLDPVVDIMAPAAGVYDIWVGAQSSGTIREGTLFFTSSDTRTPAQF